MKFDLLCSIKYPQILKLFYDALIEPNFFFICHSAQFREATKDCTLPESDDTYLLRWLVGNARKFRKL